METPSGTDRTSAKWAVECTYPLDEPRDPDDEQAARIQTIEMAMRLANDYDLASTSHVEPRDDRYGRYVETYPPGMATTIDNEGHVSELPEPVIVFMDCREEVATHAVYRAEIGATDAPG